MATEQEAVTAWLKSGEYLPPFMRDFHDQKDVFKALDDVVQNRRETDSYTRDLSWVTAQVYTVDVFLWMMARHGYTLQKTRKRLTFRDICDWTKASRERWHIKAAAVLGLSPTPAPKED